MTDRDRFHHAPRGFDSLGNPIGGYADPDTLMSDRAVAYLTRKIDDLASVFGIFDAPRVQRVIDALQAEIEAGGAYNPSDRRRIDSYVERWRRDMIATRREL